VVRLRPVVLFAGLLIVPVAVRLALLPWAPKPLPRIQDEFSYLLAADTFASGRLTNPTHPLWEFFETYHVMHKPSYASKYPPGQGLLMAAGLRLASDPWAGVLFSYAAMLAAFYWAFQGWLPGRWAAVAAVLGALRFPPYHYWANSYWGGALAACGGALLLGAAGRMRRRCDTRAGLAAGAGLAILSVSRPYEGLLLACALTLPCVGELWRRRGQWRALAPGLLLVGAVLGWQAWYNHAVTGNALKLPYLAHEEQYTLEPTFYFQAQRQGLTYRHAMLSRLHQQPIPFTREKALIQSLQILEIVRFSYRPEDVVQAAMGIAVLLAIPLALCRRSGRLPAIALILAIAPMLAQRWYMEHYGGPASSLRILVAVIGVRCAAGWLRLRWAPGLAFRMLMVAVAVQLSLFAGLSVAGRRPASGFPVQRAALVEKLARQGGKHLVIVRYGSDHDPHLEWVYNAADIDRSPIVWAQDMGEAANRRLLNYYPDRMHWLLEPERGGKLGEIKANPALQNGCTR
jgi:hypothetical protein